MGEIGQRFSLVHIMGMSSVLSKPIILMYPTIQFKYHCLVNQIINPSTPDASVMPNKEAITILWSRDGHAGDFVRRFWPRKRTQKIWAAILAAQSELERLEISFLKAPQAPGVMFWRLASNFLASSSLDLSFDTKFAVV